jgi:hypothetical protein
MRCCILKMAVVGAKDPIPSVSKKLAAKPIRTSAGRGLRVPPAARSRANQRHAYPRAATRNAVRSAYRPLRCKRLESR